MTTATDLTHATTITRYQDGADLGHIDLSREQAEQVHAAAQWPEGLLPLGELRAICDDADLGGDEPVDTTVWLD